MVEVGRGRTEREESQQKGESENKARQRRRCDEKIVPVMLSADSSWKMMMKWNMRTEKSGGGERTGQPEAKWQQRQKKKNRRRTKSQTTQSTIVLLSLQKELLSSHFSWQSLINCPSNASDQLNPTVDQMQVPEGNRLPLNFFFLLLLERRNGGTCNGPIFHPCKQRWGPGG